MTTFITREATCPNCYGTINVNILRSSNTSGERYTDFRQDAGGWQPRNVVMNLCRVCGFAGYSRSFRVENVLPESVRGKIASVILPTLPSAEVHVPASQKHAIHAQISCWLGKPAVDVGDSYLRAAWCAQDENNLRDEDEYRLTAISYYKDALNDDALEDKTLPNLTYLVGELYRRVGQTGEAYAWFSHVIDRARTDASWERMAQLARQQRDHPRDTL
ncbi:MAG: DUF2225 domain-containing protein [Chloroflexota bacterium]